MHLPVTNWWLLHSVWVWLSIKMQTTRVSQVVFTVKSANSNFYQMNKYVPRIILILISTRISSINNASTLILVSWSFHLKNETSLILSRFLIIVKNIETGNNIWYISINKKEIYIKRLGIKDIFLSLFLRLYF